MDWRTQLHPYNRRGVPLFDAAFLQRWGNRKWEPNDADRAAAASLHIEVASRITTQHLGYAAGVEAAALSSVHALFEKSRAIAHEHLAGHHFEALALHLLNAHVRPFTAKWHRRGQAGALDALDTTDEFRADLSSLQPLLADFDDLLLEIRDGSPPPASHPSAPSVRIQQEMRAPLPYGIPVPLAPVVGASAVAGDINDAEAGFVERSRALRGRQGRAGADAAGLALSGGGIRSATFSLGVLIALARRNLLPQFDYLSTVSGGGYLGAFLTTFLASPKPEAPPAVGLEQDRLPFQRQGGEAAALRHLRHNSRYLLTGSSSERMQIGFAQLYGILVNVAALAMVVCATALVEYLARTGLELVWSRTGTPPEPWGTMVANPLATLLVLAFVAVVGVQLLASFFDPVRERERWATIGLSLVVALSVAWAAFGSLHQAATVVWRRLPAASTGELAMAALALGAALLGIATLGRRLGHPRLVPVLVFAVAAPILLLTIQLATYEWLRYRSPAELALFAVALASAAAVLYAATDINITALHRHYRDKLAGTFLIQRSPGANPAAPFAAGVRIKLSAILPDHRGPYPLLNGALNVPGSRNSAMQGRLTDFFLFSPSFMGSPVTGYHPTERWEAADPDLDLATAMAVSGAAASPQAGLRRLGRLSFWLALLNVRLGYWVRVPGRGLGRGPGLRHLFQEMFGTMDETGKFLHVSDGGHIENLGVYELLRRRCKYIVAVDGEQDPAMTFHALTNLQRLAAIDMDVRIDIDLDDLRLNPAGLSRSHFKFCRIHYPGEGIGYLLYVKLSLTGNEGEFIRRYRLDEPAFPHHSTTDQFFTEAQFEAYRALGEHVGDKLFLAAVVGAMSTSSQVDMVEWFEAIGTSMLDPP